MVGNLPNFTKIDVLRCFLKFGKNIGRQELARELELGEGTVRTILDMLKASKLLDSTKKGHYVSRKGKEMLSQIYGRIIPAKIAESKSVYPNFRKVGIVFKNAPEIKAAYRLRDIAVKNGAEGALILKFRKKLYAPDMDYKQDYSEFEEQFELDENDALLIAFSDNKRHAENGALAIAVELDEGLKKFVNEFQ